MPHGVELPLRRRYLLHVERGVENAVGVPERLPSRYGVAKRVDYARASAIHHLGQERHFGRGEKICRIIVAQQVGGAVHHKAATLNGDVLDRCLPFGVAVGVGGKVDGHTLLVERRTRQRHVVLPADEGAQGAHGVWLTGK